jgi:hypothetical protein
MGGKSCGGMLRTDEGFRFEGDLSLANNGGFSSVRRALQAATVGAERVYLDIKGDKRRYQLRLRQTTAVTVSPGLPTLKLRANGRPSNSIYPALNRYFAAGLYSMQGQSTPTRSYRLGCRAPPGLDLETML